MNFNYEFTKSMFKVFYGPLFRFARSSFIKYGPVQKLTYSIPTCTKPTMVNSMDFCSSSKVSTSTLDIEVNRIVWIDMEMTGLDIDHDKIMEIASLITDSDLNIIAECPEIVIHQPESIINNMEAWCLKQHGKTGLSEACLKSTTTLEEAEELVFNFISKHVTENHSPLAGNSVYMDRLFLLKHMPKVHKHLHYRIIDVSTVKEMCRRWNPKLYSLVPKKEYTHRALLDIRESVDELKFYKSNFFKLN